jgi:hypothetical protein
MKKTNGAMRLPLVQPTLETQAHVRSAMAGLNLI